MIKGKERIIIFWLSQFISAVGDNLFFASLLFLILLIEKEKASFKAGITSFSETLPYLIFGIFAGFLVDRFKKKKVMIYSDLLRALILFLIPLLYKNNFLNFITLSISAFLLSSFSSFFFPARDSVIPKIAEGKTLLRINAFIQSSTQIAQVIGTFLAGFLLTILKGDPVNKILNLFLIDGITFFISFLLIGILFIPEDKKTKIPLKTDFIEGLKFILKDKLLRGLLILTALDNLFIMGPAVVGANLLIKNYFNLKAHHLAYFHSFLSFGWLVGTIFIAKYGIYYKKRLLLIFGIFMDGITYIPFIFIKNYYLALLMILIHGFFISFITVPRTTLIQEYVPERYIARVFSMIQLTVIGFMAISSLLTGILGEYLSPPLLFLIGGSGGALTGLFAFFFFKTLRKINF
ncbi:MAG: MFS transporter [candidate division WOR-3 bacterium]